MLTSAGQPTAATRPAGALVIETVAVRDLGAERMAQWSELYSAQQGPANPFCSPLWVTTWLDHYVPAEDHRLIWLYDGGRLVSVAPMYQQQVRIGPMRLANRLTLAGNGLTSPFELPQVLCAAGYGRAVIRTLVQYTVGQPVNWSELTLSREQGWFQPGWEGGNGPQAEFSRHQNVRACVVKELGATWDETRSGLKRNVKESLRRARNRLNKDGRPWQIVHRTGTGLDLAVVDRWLGLHEARSQHEGSWAQHGNAFADDGPRTLIRGLLPRLGAAEQASIVELELDGQVVAAQLVLQAPGTIYFHSSGFLSEVWKFSPVTALQGAAMEEAINRGDRWVNFSPGPNESKLRWSENLWVMDDFAYGTGSRADMARYAAFFVAKDLKTIVHVHREAAKETGALKQS